MSSMVAQDPHQLITHSTIPQTLVTNTTIIPFDDVNIEACSVCFKPSKEFEDKGGVWIIAKQKVRRLSKYEQTEVAFKSMRFVT